MITSRAKLMMLIIGMAVAPATSQAFDGFEKFSFRELSRAFGVGLGPGYHNQPCNPKLAKDYNKMLRGCGTPGHVAQYRAFMAPRVPHGPTPSYWPGENGTPQCQSCGQAGNWSSDAQFPMHPLATGAVQEPTPALNREIDVYGPTTEMEVEEALDLQPEAEVDGPSIEQLPDSTTPDASSPTIRSIEEMLDGLKDGEPADQATFNDYVPGEELWNHLSPEARELFKREFPERELPQTQSQAEGRSPEKSSAKPGQSNGFWW